MSYHCDAFSKGVEILSLLTGERKTEEKVSWPPQCRRPAPRVLIKQTGNVCSPGSCHVYDLLFLKNNAAGSDSPHQCGPCWHKSTSHTPSWVICKPQGEATWALTDHWQALPRHLRRLTASAALFSNLALKYAAVFNSQLLSARLAVSVQKCRVCLTFLKRFCNRGKRLSWPQCVISGTLPV